MDLPNVTSATSLGVNSAPEEKSPGDSLDSSAMLGTHHIAAEDRLEHVPRSLIQRWTGCEGDTISEEAKPGFLNFIITRTNEERRARGVGNMSHEQEQALRDALEQLWIESHIFSDVPDLIDSKKIVELSTRARSLDSELVGTSSSLGLLANVPTEGGRMAPFVALVLENNPARESEFALLSAIQLNKASASDHYKTGAQLLSRADQEMPKNPRLASLLKRAAELHEVIATQRAEFVQQTLSEIKTIEDELKRIESLSVSAASSLPRSQKPLGLTRSNKAADAHIMGLQGRHDELITILKESERFSSRPGRKESCLHALQHATEALEKATTASDPRERLLLELAATESEAVADFYEHASLNNEVRFFQERTLHRDSALSYRLGASFYEAARTYGAADPELSTMLSQASQLHESVAKEMSVLATNLHEPVSAGRRLPPELVAAMPSWHQNEQVPLQNDALLVPEKIIRLLSKLASVDEVPGADGAQRRSVHEVLDRASTGATQQFATEVEFGKKSIEEVTRLKKAGPQGEGNLQAFKNEMGARGAYLAAIARRIHALNEAVMAFRNNDSEKVTSFIAAANKAREDALAALRTATAYQEGGGVARSQISW